MALARLWGGAAGRCRYRRGVELRRGRGPRVAQPRDVRGPAHGGGQADSGSAGGKGHAPTAAVLYDGTPSLRGPPPVRESPRGSHAHGWRRRPRREGGQKEPRAAHGGVTPCLCLSPSDHLPLCPSVPSLAPSQSRLACPATGARQRQQPGALRLSRGLLPLPRARGGGGTPGRALQAHDWPTASRPPAYTTAPG